MDFYGGYILSFRSWLDWEWYDNYPTFRTFFHILHKAAWKDGTYHGRPVLSGQWITTVKEISEQTGLTIRQTRTALNNLQTTNELTIKTTSKNTIITVNFWGQFMGNDKQNDKQTTNKRQTKRQTNDKQTTNNVSLYNKTSKTGKTEETGKQCVGGEAASHTRPSSACKNSSLSLPTPEYSEVFDYVNSKGYIIDAQRFFNYYEAQGWKRHGQSITNWKAMADDWERSERQKQQETAQGRTVGEPSTQSSFNIDDLSSLGILYDLKEGGENYGH